MGYKKKGRITKKTRLSEFIMPTKIRNYELTLSLIAIA
jgi:hypothetical protein